MRNNVHMVLILSLLALTACSDPVIDASTEKSMKTSFEKIYQALPGDQKAEFKFSYGAILYAYRTSRSFKKKGDSKALINKRIKAAINGKNAQEINSIYRDVKKTKSLWAIQNIKNQIEQRADDVKQLKTVIIESYDLRLAPDGSRERMFLQATIYNGSKYTLSDVLFVIRIGSSFSDTLLSQNRNLYITFPDGLEQGHSVIRNIDLGRPTAHFYLPRKPVIAEYLTGRITGQGVDITARLHPDIAFLEKTLREKEREHNDAFYEN